MLGLLMTSVLVSAMYSGVQTPSPDALRHALQADGANVVVNHLLTSGEWWAVTRQIGSGREAWIELAPDLSSGTDAATSETLSISLAQALPKSPGAVLAILDPTGQSGALSVRKVCSAPFIEESAEHMRKYELAALRALNRVRDSRLQEIGAACISELRGIR